MERRSILRKSLKATLTFTVYILSFLALVLVIGPAFEEIYRLYGSYPFLLGIGAYFLVNALNKKKGKALENANSKTKNTKSLMIATGVVFAAPVIISQFYLALPGTLPWSIIPSSSTADIVNEAKICKDDPLNEGDKCIFKIGPDLEFEILAVGTPIATAYVNEANPPEKAYYHIGFASHDPCIRVISGEKMNKRISLDYLGKYFFQKDRAWLSPFDAVAYNSYEECIEKAEASQRNFSRIQANL